MSIERKDKNYAAQAVLIYFFVNRERKEIGNLFSTNDRGCDEADIILLELLSRPPKVEYW